MLCLKLKKWLTNTQKGIRINDLLILKNNLAMSLDPPTGSRKLTDFLIKNKDTIGKEYISSTKRYYMRWI